MQFAVCATESAMQCSKQHTNLQRQNEKEAEKNGNGLTVRSLFDLRKRW